MLGWILFTLLRAPRQLQRLLARNEGIAAVAIAMAKAALEDLRLSNIQSWRKGDECYFMINYEGCRMAEDSGGGFCTSGNPSGKVWLCVFRWAATRPKCMASKGTTKIKKEFTTTSSGTIMVGCVPFCSHQLTSPPVEKSLKHLDTRNALHSAGVHITEQLRVDRLSGRFTWSRARQNEATDGPGGFSWFQLSMSFPWPSQVTLLDLGIPWETWVFWSPGSEASGQLLFDISSVRGPGAELWVSWQLKRHDATWQLDGSKMTIGWQ